MQQHKQMPATRPTTKKRASQVSPAVQLKQLKRREKSDLPDPLRDGIEQLSGLSMAGVRVHRNSAAPADLGAHAYAQGRDIHLAPGQDHHLPHEAWHVVQQAQGRVKATTALGGVPINDAPGLEREADVMGAHAAQFVARKAPSASAGKPAQLQRNAVVTQCLFEDEAQALRAEKTLAEASMRAALENEGHLVDGVPAGDDPMASPRRRTVFARTEGGGFVQTQRNLARATVNISILIENPNYDGSADMYRYCSQAKESRQLAAFSGERTKCLGMQEAADPVFQAIDAENAAGHMTDRTHDSEKKILESLSVMLSGLGVPNDHIFGTIDLVSAFPICPSCTDVILAFCALYPNINFRSGPYNNNPDGQTSPADKTREQFRIENDPKFNQDQFPPLPSRNP